ncbi:MAG: hypothetical protein K0R54_4448 [Clostridiaceae bacterium]|jgi:tetratricopeptide (TPR) repeat protein|nr:hypothetical protein [Clostridiaceae bacterium]
MSEEINNQHEEHYTEPDQVPSCKNCGSLEIEEGYSLTLCRECRDKLSKRPFPMKIKLALALIFLIIIVSLSKFPSTIYAGVEFQKGLQAEKELKFITAIHHYENADKAYPQADKILVRLYSAYFRNENIPEARKVLAKLTDPDNHDRKVDEKLANEANGITRKLDNYCSISRELSSQLYGMENAKPDDILKILKPFVDNGTNVNAYTQYYLADLYFDKKNYNEANNILSKVISENQDFYAAYLLQAAAYRETGNWEQAIQCADKVLKDNVESISAYVTLSKIELKRKNNAKGLQYAKNAYNLDSSDPYVIANLALAYHYNNLTDERDKYYKIYKQFNIGDQYTDNLLKSIFDGSLQWQI